MRTGPIGYVVHANPREQRMTIEQAQYGRTDLSYNRAAAEAVCDAFRRALYHGQGPAEPQEVS